MATAPSSGRSLIVCLHVPVFAAALLAGVLARPAVAAFVTFESGQVRPLALAPSGNMLFAVNTPDDRLEIFTVGSGGLTHTGSVTVGLEPVAVAARNDSEVWVVNHLSDSVSIVDVASSPPRVVRTLLVGDEPRDIVFAGPSGNRAFITTARRGQNLPAWMPPLLTSPSVPRALVWVFDATDLGDSLGGDPLTIVPLFGDTPRALAASPDGSRVYAAVFHSGNQTTAVSEGAVCNDNLINGMPSGPCSLPGGTMPGSLLPPETNIAGTLRPETGLIVKYNPVDEGWQDEIGRNWNPAVKFNLPDKDVFVINANSTPPAQLGGAPGFFAGVGTVIFNMAVNPAQPTRVYVTNTEARNEVRFEGPGIFGGSSVRGHLHEARVTILDGAIVTPRHLNKHLSAELSYAEPDPTSDKDHSLATPVGLAVTADGATLYVAAFGSSKIGVFDTGELLGDTFTPDVDDHIDVSGGGPSGLVLDEANDRLYVLTRFDNSISVIDTVLADEIDHLPLYNPEPPHVVDGRPFLYDAVFTSSNGEASCSSCHIFGDFDSLAWELGNPDDPVLNNPNPFRVPDLLGLAFADHHPMKGPMTTQSLRGMANHGPMHWRGDRTGGNDPGGNALDEVQAFKKFNVAFDGLLGRGDGPIPDADMTAFTNFILDVTYPPNPIRNLDNSLTPDQDAGRNFYIFSTPSDVFESCNGCHVLNPAAGFFGSDGLSSFEFEPQNLKIPHLRNMYQKVGMFGLPAIAFVNSGDNGHMGDQVRGFGFLHDGSIDTVFRFHNATVFNQTNPGGFPIPNPGGIPDGFAGDTIRRQLEAFLLAFDSNMAPIVGQQATLTESNGQAVEQRALGRRLSIRDPSGGSAARRITVRSADTTITIPAPGSPSDPRCNGDLPDTITGQLKVMSSTSGQSHTVDLECQFWTLLGSESNPRGYRYLDRDLVSSSVRRIMWRDGRGLRATLSGAGIHPITYDLASGVNQGMVDVELSSGEERVCIRCQDVDFLSGNGTTFVGRTTECDIPLSCLTPNARSRIDLFIERASVLPTECDLVVKGTLAGQARGWRYRPGMLDFQSDRATDAPLSEAQLRALATAGQELTFTCVPPGSGVRVGIDRDEDGFFDRDELDGGSDPADPGSTP
jgi:DNA-binding beta-propeller fold protein YncE